MEGSRNGELSLDLGGIFTDIQREISPAFRKNISTDIELPLTAREDNQEEEWALRDAIISNFLGNGRNWWEVPPKVLDQVHSKLRC